MLNIVNKLVERIGHENAEKTVELFNLIEQIARGDQMIHILVDSAADFSKKEIEEKGIHLVPLQVNFQEEQYLDGVNLERDEFYEKLVYGKRFSEDFTAISAGIFGCI